MAAKVVTVAALCLCACASEAKWRRYNTHDVGNGFVTASTDVGLLLLHRNSFTSNFIITHGEYSPYEVSLFRQIVGTGDFVVDVGAHVGVFSVLFGTLVGPTGRVLSFEPQRHLFSMLHANLALNSLLWVDAVNGAAGRAAGTIDVPVFDLAAQDVPSNFASSGNSSWSRVVRAQCVAFSSVVTATQHWQQGDAFAETSAGVVPIAAVPLVTLDEHLEGAYPDCPKLIKVDVEGMELAVLQGAVRTLATCHPVLFLENNSKDTSPALLAHLGSSGFECFWAVHPSRRVDNYYVRGAGVCVLGGGG